MVVSSNLDLEFASYWHLLKFVALF
jgi:hypothetical protein